MASETKVFSISIRVFHSTMSALDIVRLIGLSPGTSQSVGEGRRTRGGALPGVYHRTFVGFPLDVSGSSLDECINASLDPPFPGHEQTSPVIETGGRIEFFVGMTGPSNCHVELTPVMMARLSAQRVFVWLNIYAAGFSETENG